MRRRWLLFRSEKAREISVETCGGVFVPRGVLAAIPGISLIISAIDYPARASEFGHGTAIGMTVFDNIPIVDNALAITEGIDAVQQERIKAEREHAIDEARSIDELMCEAREAGEVFGNEE